MAVVSLVHRNTFGYRRNTWQLQRRIPFLSNEDSYTHPSFVAATRNRSRMAASITAIQHSRELSCLSRLA
jgi:hypothetical protein